MQMMPENMNSRPELSIIVPMHNEEDACGLFFEKIFEILPKVTDDYEIVCINDGSTDATLAALKVFHAQNPRIRIINFSRNFCKEAALTAGLDLAAGRAVIPIDVDLQDPPELIIEMMEKLRDGARVVLARRVDRTSDSFLKRATSTWFYDIFGAMAKPSIPKNVGDFRLMDRAVVEAIKQLPERTRFMKGVFAWVGFDAVTIDYTRPERMAGSTKFNFIKLWNFALEGIFSFTSVPLKIWSYFGVFLSMASVFFMFYLILKTLITGVDVPGYASIMTMILFFNGIILLSLGALGEYVGRIFIEVKQRPQYIVDELVGFQADDIRARAPQVSRTVLEYTQ